MGKSSEEEMTCTVYVVTVDDCESTRIVSIHKTMEGALDAWNFERLWLIKEYKDRLTRYEEKWGSDDDMYGEMICCLENTNPETISNYPHDCPHIEEYRLFP